MENKTTKNKPKKRSNEYESKVKFDGKFIDMVKMSVKDAEKKKEKPKN